MKTLWTRIRTALGIRPRAARRDPLIRDIERWTGHR